jgi:hypothetical protein
MNQELHSRLLQRALEIVGGKAQLCRQLGIERHSLEFWLAGRATPPYEVVFAAAELVLKDDVSRASQDRRKELRETAAPVEPPARAA